MRLALLGATGQVGFELLRSLQPVGDVVALSRGQLDIDQPRTMARVLDELRPDCIVNAAAWTAVDAAESQPEAAHRANAQTPAQLAQWCSGNEARLIHYSTDYIFSGQSSADPWREQDSPVPQNVYGQSKWEGEQAITASGCEHLIIRTAWVYAARGQNFLRTMLRLAGERSELSVVSDQIGTPTWARYIADTTAQLVQRRASGAVHVTCAGQASWHDFAQAIFDLAEQSDHKFESPQVKACPTSDYPTPAQRPAWSVLDCSRLEQEFGIHRPHWRTCLELCMNQMK